MLEATDGIKVRGALGGHTSKQVQLLTGFNKSALQPLLQKRCWICSRAFVARLITLWFVLSWSWAQGPLGAPECESIPGWNLCRSKEGFCQYLERVARTRLLFGETCQGEGLQCYSCGGEGLVVKAQLGSLTGPRKTNPSPQHCCALSGLTTG